MDEESSQKRSICMLTIVRKSGWLYLAMKNFVLTAGCHRPLLLTPASNYSCPVPFSVMEVELEEADFGDKLGIRSLYQISALQHHQQCLSSNTSIGGDATGLRAYCGSHVVTRLSAAYSRLLDGKNIVELGCGIGVCGLIGTSFSKPSLLVLTDGQERSGHIVEMNIDYVKQSEDSHIANVPTLYRRLLWGDGDATEQILHDLSRSLKPNSTFYDIVLGCELMYYNTDVEVLVQQVMALTKGQGLFIHGHLFRGQGQEKELITVLAAHQWSTLEIPHKDFISSEEMKHHIEWYRARPLISGPNEVIAQLAQEHPTWREFKEELTYDCEEEDTDNADALLSNIFS